MDGWQEGNEIDMKCISVQMLKRALYRHARYVLCPQVSHPVILKRGDLSCT